MKKSILKFTKVSTKAKKINVENKSIDPPLVSVIIALLVVSPLFIGRYGLVDVVLIYIIIVIIFLIFRNR